MSEYEPTAADLARLARARELSAQPVDLGGDVIKIAEQLPAERREEFGTLVDDVLAVEPRADSWIISLSVEADRRYKAGDKAFGDGLFAVVNAVSHLIAQTEAKLRAGEVPPDGTAAG